MIRISSVRPAQCRWSVLAVLAACGAWLSAQAQAQPDTDTQPPAQSAPAEPSASTNPPAASTPPEPAVPSGRAPEGSAPQADEVIRDPELQNVSPAPEASASEADGVIDDPELRALPEAAVALAPPAEPNGQVRIVLHSRLGVDTQWQDPREDVWEATQIALFEAKVRRSEHLRFEVGVRARYMFASREHASDDAGAARYELDLAPTAAYADATLRDGLHLRVGYQGVRLGRFDALNPSDILHSYDLRSGMATMPEANEIAQPAVRVDWDAGSWLSLTVIGLPFFQPHVVREFEGDYALLRSRDADVNAFYGLFPNPQATRALVRSTLSRTGQGRLGEGAFAAFAPRPNFTNPQAALRIIAHGPAGELGLTAGTALEHLPTFRLSDAFMTNAALQQRVRDVCPNNPTSARCTSLTQTPLLPDPHPISVSYDRFELLSIDGAMPLGPLQLGVELAYMFDRAQLAVPSGLPKRSDIAHAGLRLEWLRSQSWVIALETSAERAIQLPSDSDRFLLMTKDGWLLAALGFVTMAPFDGGPLFELGGGVFNGPSYLLAPRIEQRLVDRFYIEAGAALLAGKRRPLTSPRVTLGGLYSDTNQVFVGLRWLP